jgi:hypothetical protein
LDSSAYRNDNNKLLYLIEKSRLLLKKKLYYEAELSLFKSQALLKELYTVSIKKKIVSNLLSEEKDNYYGKIFERSFLFQTQVLLYLKIYSSPYFYKRKTLKEKFVRVELNKNERLKFLKKAKSVVIAWNSFYETLRNKTNKDRTQNYYQYLLAAIVHEAQGQKSELKIASILYRKILDNLKYMTKYLPLFNERYEENLKNYLSSKKQFKYKHTEFYKDLEQFILKRYFKVLNKLSNKKFKKEAKRLSYHYDKNKVKTHSLLLDVGYTSLMETKIISYNLNSALTKIEDPALRKTIELIGITTLSLFALNTLGYGHYVYRSNEDFVYYNGNAIGELVKNVGIDIKIPIVEFNKIMPKIRLLNEKREEMDSDITLLQSLEQELYITTKEYANRYYDSFGPKIALKYAAAIAAAYGTYKSLKDDPMGRTLALTQFFLSQKAIGATASVDLRQISSMPKCSFIIDANLTKGKYILEVESKTQEKKELEFRVSDSTTSLFAL